ncbi:MAG: helix-turn-helix domain-containing protein [Thermoanaerobaculia bacterium]
MSSASVAASRPEGPRQEWRHPRTRVLRGCHDGAAWELWLRQPPPALAHLFRQLWAGDSQGGPARHRSVPDGELWLEFNLGVPQRVTGARGQPDGGETFGAALVTGLQDAPLTFVSLHRHPRVVGARLHPRGALAFFGGLPLEELAHRAIDLESALGGFAGVEPLRQRLVETADLGAALELLEQWLVARLLAGPSPHPLTCAALERLDARERDLRIEPLARELGVSVRYVHRLFRREVGFPVKAFARVRRFQRALDRLIARRGRDLASVAGDCGYYDQAHMNRDFRELAGLTPTECLARVFQVDGWREIGG